MKCTYNQFIETCFRELKKNSMTMEMREGIIAD